MYQLIHEKIDVVAVYKHGKLEPRVFGWHGRRYLVDEVTFVTDLKDGGVPKRVYAVMAGANAYRLLFDRSSEIWFLEEVWCE